MTNTHPHAIAARDNWFHADLDLERFIALQRERGETLVQLAGRASLASLDALRVALLGGGGTGVPGESLAESLRRRTRAAQLLLPLPLLAQLLLHASLSAADAQPLSRSPVVHSFLNWDVASGLKLVLGEQLADANGIADSLKHSVILGDRNGAAMDALRDALASGSRRVAILYGSAHLPDLERRMVEELGARRAAQLWLPAWRVALPRAAAAARVAQLAPLQLRRPQVAALFGLSVMLATDLYLWELLFRWAGLL